MGNPFVTITGYDIDDYIDDYIGEPLYMDYIDDNIGDYHNPLTGKPLFFTSQYKETTEGFENSSTVILLEASLG